MTAGRSGSRTSSPASTRTRGRRISTSRGRWSGSTRSCAWSAARRKWLGLAVASPRIRNGFWGRRGPPQAAPVAQTPNAAKAERRRTAPTIRPGATRPGGEAGAGVSRSGGGRSSWDRPRPRRRSRAGGECRPRRSRRSCPALLPRAGCGRRRRTRPALARRWPRRPPDGPSGAVRLGRPRRPVRREAPVALSDRERGRAGDGSGGAGSARGALPQAPET